MKAADVEDAQLQQAIALSLASGQPGAVQLLGNDWELAAACSKSTASYLGLPWWRPAWCCGKHAVSPQGRSLQVSWTQLQDCSQLWACGNALQSWASWSHQTNFTAAGPPLKAASKSAPDVANPWEDEGDDEWEDVDARPAQPAAPPGDLPGGPSRPLADARQCRVDLWRLWQPSSF